MNNIHPAAAIASQVFSVSLDNYHFIQVTETDARRDDEPGFKVELCRQVCGHPVTQLGASFLTASELRDVANQMDRIATECAMLAERTRRAGEPQ